MRIRIEIFAAGEPPLGAPMLVQILDTSRQDAPGIVLAETRGVFGGVVELDTPQPGEVYVHVDVDGDGNVGEGDFITMQSYPCSPDMRVEVRKV